MNRTHTGVFAIALLVLALVGTADGRPQDNPTVAAAVQPPPAEEVQAAGIRSQTAWTRSAGPAGALGEGHVSSSVTFDRQGLSLEQIAYDENGVVLQSIVNTYDGEGRLVESVSEEHTGTGNARTLFGYDGELITGTVAYRPDGSVLVTTGYVYNEDGNVLEAVTEIPDADISQRTVFNYSEDGDVVSTVSYDGAGNVLAASETVNDSEGRPVESTATLPDGTVGSVTSYTYDSDGRLLEASVKNSEGTVLSTVSQIYSVEGLMVEVVATNPPAGIEQRVVVEYDEASQRLVEQTYNKLGQLVGETRYEYEYYEDEEGTED